MRPGGRPTVTEAVAARELLGVGAETSREDVIGAWKRALRVTHPDTADETNRDDAERLTKRLNEAKDVVLAAIDRGIEPPPPPPPPLAPMPHTRPVPAPQHVATAPRGPNAYGYRPPPRLDHVPTTPRSEPARNRWLLAGALVMLGLLVVVAYAVLGSPSDQGRITETPTTTSEPRPQPAPVPTSGAGSSLQVRTPESAVQLLLANFDSAAGAPPSIVDPQARGVEIQDLMTTLYRAARVDSNLITRATRSVTCDQQPGLDVARCTVHDPSGFIPDLDVREGDDGWRVFGYYAG